jgi:hypothetical protein
VVASASYVGMTCEEKEPVGDGVDETVGNLEAAALRSDAKQMPSSSDSACGEQRCPISAAFVARR